MTSRVIEYLGPLISNIQRVSRYATLTAAGVSLYDYETDLFWSSNGDRQFHAASTIKLAVMLGAFKAVEEGIIDLSDQLHVRNRFLSAADKTPYHVENSRDGDTEVYQRIGRTMSIDELVELMIIRSSNLATNLLVDFLGAEYIQRVLQKAGAQNIYLKRGVEDHRAFNQGINNEVTANGLVQVLRAIYEPYFFSTASRDRMLEVLLKQNFNSMIPAALPSDVRVAHKTGEISTVSHDVGLVFVPNRKPYILAILTEFVPGKENHAQPLAGISLAVYEFLMRQTLER